jgi:hypothetical protein
MKKSLLLKIAGVVLIAAGTFFTPVTPTAKAAPGLCLPEGAVCPWPRAPNLCCDICVVGRCRKLF